MPSRRYLLPLLASVALPPLALAAPAVAVVTPAALYHCQPRGEVARPPPEPVVPGEASATSSQALAADQFRPVCAPGSVPYPVSLPGGPKMLPPTLLPRHLRTAAMRRLRHGGRRHSRVRAHAARTNLGGWYSWSQGDQHFVQGANVWALFVQQSNEQPYIDYTKGITNAHSLAQLWALAEPNTSFYSDVETGWSESGGQFGDVNPHLFMAAFDQNVFLGYVGQSGMPWVQSSSVAFPNMTVTHNDTFHTYGVALYGTNWWFYYDGQWVGYLPQSAWRGYFPSSITDAAAGGEVSTIENVTCTDMGDAGRFGSNSTAAMFNQVWYQGAKGSVFAQLSPYDSDPGNYATGNWNGGWQFRYGGPGWC